MQTIVLYLCYIVLILLFSTAYNTSLIYCFVIWCLHTNKRRPCSSTLSGHPSSSFFIVMSRFAWYLQCFHGFPHFEAFTNWPCFQWWKNDYEVWHVWLFFFSEWLSCANQHVPALEVTWERKERSIKRVLKVTRDWERQDCSIKSVLEVSSGWKERSTKSVLEVTWES